MRASAAIDQALVERIRDRIVDACAPRYLFVFGSVARGEETPTSDLDLLVVTDGTDSASPQEQTTALRTLIRERGLPLDLVVQTPNQFRDQLRLPGFIARTAYRDGHLLYSKEALPPMPSPEYNEAAQAWYEQGEHDQRMARILLSADPPELGGVAFHSQQAVEKYFKSILALCGEDPPHTHDLSVLLDRIEEHEPEFEGFRSAAEEMSPFAVAVRYPNPEQVPTKDEARALVEQVDRIRSEIQERLS